MLLAVSPSCRQFGATWPLCAPAASVFFPFGSSSLLVCVLHPKSRFSAFPILVPLPLLARGHVGDVRCLSRHSAGYAASLSRFCHICFFLNRQLSDCPSNRAPTLLGHHRRWFVGWSSRHVDRVRVVQLRCGAQPPLVIQRCWKCRSGVNSMLEIECQCPLVARCRGCCCISPFFCSSFFAKTFRESTQLRGFLCALFLLTCPPSSGGPEVLGVSFRGQFNVKTDSRCPLFDSCRRC